MEIVRAVRTTYYIGCALLLAVVSSVAHAQAPRITVLTPPDGSEVAPGSDLTIRAQVEAPNGLRSIELYWGHTSRPLPCPGSGPSWQCTPEADMRTFKWVLNLSTEAVPRTYVIRATDQQNAVTSTPERMVYARSSLTGLAVSLVTPASGSAVPPDTAVDFAVLVQGEGTVSASGVHLRFAGAGAPDFAFALEPDPSSPGLWRLPARSLRDAAGGAQTFFVDATTQSGAVAVAGPFRVTVGTAPTPGTGNFLVRVHTTQQIDDARADAILREANSVLTVNDGGYDVACPLPAPLTRNGPVTEFAFTDGVIDTEFEMEQLLSDSGGGAFVIRSIGYCGGAGSAIGCSRPGAPIVVVRRPQYLRLEGVLWAHEFGHNRRLGHNNSTLNVMAELIDGDYRRIYDSQCRNYQQPLRDLSFKLVSEVSNTVPQRKPLLEFLRTIPVERFPFQEAEAYASEVPRLLQQLRRPAVGVYLPNVPATLGAIGNPAAVAPLIDFIERGSGRLSDDEFNARRDALIALGAIAAQSRSQRSIDYLLARQEASSWNDNVRWLPPRGMGESDERNKMLLISTIYGLGVSGDARAAEALRRMLSQTRSRLATTTDAEARYRAKELESALAHALATNEVVSRVGIRAYRARVQ